MCHSPWFVASWAAARIASKPWDGLFSRQRRALRIPLVLSFLRFCLSRFFFFLTIAASQDNQAPLQVVRRYAALARPPFHAHLLETVEAVSFPWFSHIFPLIMQRQWTAKTPSQIDVRSVSHFSAVFRVDSRVLFTSSRGHSIKSSVLGVDGRELLRSRNDDSSHNSRIRIGARSSKLDAMVDNGLASLARPGRTHLTRGRGAIVREMFAVRNRITLKAETALVWAAVRSWQLLERLLRDCE